MCVFVCLLLFWFVFGLLFVVVGFFLFFSQVDGNH